jgi:hypothetical protein
MNLDGAYSLSLRQGYYGYATERIFESKFSKPFSFNKPLTDGPHCPIGITALVAVPAA